MKPDSSRVLIVEDDIEFSASLKLWLESKGHTVECVANVYEGLARARTGGFDVVLSDLQLPGPGGMEVLGGLKIISQLRASKPHLPVILMTAHATVEAAIESMKLGAFDYVLKQQSTPQELIGVLDKAVAAGRLMSERVELGAAVTQGDALIGRSRAMQRVYKEIGRLAAKPVTVLIRGESGTGKGLVARAIYGYSDRANQPLIAVNCGAIAENLLESELFGHEPGAFTGAQVRRIGRLEAANHGTIFLDEIGDISLNLQKKLLRVLKEKNIERVGGRETLSVDVRVLAATDRDLELAVQQHEFRQDLYFRLSVAVVELPPLRERTEDIPDLAEYFIRRHGLELGSTWPNITSDAIECLRQHAWPGNVSEFETVIRRALLLANGYTITGEMIRNFLRPPRMTVLAPDPAVQPCVPDHELLRRIGEGAFGEVWLARNVLGTYRAIKVIRRSSFKDSDIYEKEFRGIQKFEPISREHEGFVDILHVGRNEEEAFYYYVMEPADDRVHGADINPEIYVPNTLWTVLSDRKRLPVGECLKIGLPLAAALEHLHGRGLIHRDIKPSNIIFAKGIPKLADIGLVTNIGQASYVGTEGYIPPEGPGKEQADLYSLGMVLYEISTGQEARYFPLLPTDATGEMLRLNEIILKACDSDFRKRYKSALRMHADLVRLQRRLARCAEHQAT